MPDLEMPHNGVMWAWQNRESIHAFLQEPDHLVIVPTGATEQHGPHLPPVVDGFLATSVAAAAARQAETRVLVAPTMTMGVSKHHARFPGTVWLQPQTFRSMALDVASSLAEAGVKRVLFLNGHGGNSATLAETAYTWGAHHQNSACRVYTANYWMLSPLPKEELLPWGPGTTGHAGALETSLMLHLASDSVGAFKEADPTPGFSHVGFAPDLLDGSTVEAWTDFAVLSSNGVVGRPSQASAEHGSRAFQSFVDGLVIWIQQTTQR